MRVRICRDLVLLVLLAPAVSGADPGRVRVSGSAAAGRAGTSNYAVVGLGAGVGLARGLELALNGEAWFGHPTLYKVSPGLTYTRPGADFSPYVGAFYRRTFITGPGDDQDSIGGRAGVSRAVSAHASVGGGVVYERFLHCRETPVTSCTEIYPEAHASFSF